MTTLTHQRSAAVMHLRCLSRCPPRSALTVASLSRCCCRLTSKTALPRRAAAQRVRQQHCSAVHARPPDNPESAVAKQSVASEALQRVDDDSYQARAYQSNGASASRSNGSSEAFAQQPAEAMQSHDVAAPAEEGFPARYKIVLSCTLAFVICNMDKVCSHRQQYFIATAHCLDHHRATRAANGSTPSPQEVSEDVNLALTTMSLGCSRLRKTRGPRCCR